MNRRQFLTRATALAATGPLALPHTARGQDAPRPNVLFLMCDQLNRRVLSAYGGPVPTPHIDRIAKEGVLFTDAVCPTPFCSPTRASIETGLVPHAHGITYNTNPRMEGITPADRTMGKLLHAAGYDTHQYGKWHLMGKPVPYYPDMYDGHQYFKEMADVFAKVREERPPERRMQWYAWPLPVTIDPRFQKAVDALGARWAKHRFAEFLTKMGRLDLPLEQHWDVRFADRAIERLRRLDDRPFLLTCSFVCPHDPNVVPSPYYEMFDPAKIELPANYGVREKRFERDWSRRILAGLGKAGAREFLRVYYAMVKLVDDQVGRLLDALEKTGRARDTLVVFTADHGDMAAAHGMAWKSTSAFYDDVATVPLLLRFPGRLPAGVKTDLPANLTDLMPTILSLLGQPVPEGVQGHDLAPWIRQERDAPPPPSFTFSERVNAGRGTRTVPPTARGHFMARGSGWKYCRYWKNEEYLYDLANDPGETRNLAADPTHAPRKAELRRALLQWLKDTAYPGRA